METDLAKQDALRINNGYYHQLAERWYTAEDDPIALLRAESRLRNAWIIERIGELLPGREPRCLSVLDVGCGGGFLSNALAAEEFQVTGVDLSEPSLEVARKMDPSGRAKYVHADAYALPFMDGEFDVVTSTDFLEHVSDPRRVIAEVQRVLKPGGIFFFHTFNKNKIAEWLVIRSLEIFVKNTPPDLHKIEMFIRPEDLKAWMEELGLQTIEMRGVRPVIFQMPMLKLIFKGIVPSTFRFVWTKSLKISYTGIARKAGL